MSENKTFSVLQRVGRSFMLPIALLPVAGLLLGIGSSFTNEAMISAYRLSNILGEGTILNSILKVMAAVGDIIFGNLPLIFAIGVAIGMADREKETAALSGAIAFLVMHAAIGAMIRLTDAAGSFHEGAIASVLGIESLQMGVFGGIIVGLGVAALHNRFYKIKLPAVISFFGGTRFIPIISTLVYMVVGVIMFWAWPIIQNWIYALGGLVTKAGYGGTLIYGIIERALIPFGLHHVFYMPFWQTGLGGSMMIDGKMVEGAQNIFFAQLASPDTTRFSVDACRFMSGKFPFMMFGLPGAALAMYVTAKDTKKKVVGGLLLSAALTAFLTGITEPIEFTFIFVAPVLYAVHCVLAGLSFMLMHILNVAVGMTFSGGFIDFVLFGVLPGAAKTNWPYIVLVGAVYFVIYFFLFRFMIRKMNLKTPGREEDDEETKLYTRKDVNAAKEAKADGKIAGEEATPEPSSDSAASLIVKGLGGKENIDSLDCCATRLRVRVHHPEVVNETLLKQSGAKGVIQKGPGVQVIYGPQVSVIKSECEDYLDTL